MMKLALLALVICPTAVPVLAQPVKSLGELEAATFQAGPAPFEKPPAPVRLRDGPLKHAAAPNDIILDGEWQLVEGGDASERLHGDWDHPIRAAVPGSVHSALWGAGVIPDPYFGKNQSAAEQYSYKTWWYKKTFAVETPLNSPRLTFHGVGNHCSVWLNGIKLGTHEGMFGGPSFDVSTLLRDTNVLIVRLDPIPEVFRDDDRASSNESWNRTVVFNNVYGWHYSKIPSLGIWRSVIIQNQAGVELEHPFIATRNTDGLMNLSVGLKSVSAAIHGTLRVSVSPENFKGRAQSFEYPILSGNAAETLTFAFAIRNPQLWWPNGMGGQNLYRLRVSFVPKGGAPSDFHESTFGIRTLRMAPLPGGPFTDKYDWTFVINGKPRFVKGTGWCTMDPLLDFSRERYDRFLSLAKAQNVQMLRAWGSGMPETDDFYELCDRYGILVIQEWPTAWNSHESQPFDVLQETVELTTLRIRNHPSLAMYGGGNESSKPFGRAIDMFGRLGIELDGTRPFHRGAPWGGSDHNYACWWLKAHLDHNLNMVSSFWGEFGIASFPVRESVSRYLPDSEQNEWPPAPDGSFVHHTPVFNRAEDMERLAQYSGYVMPGDTMDHFITGSQLAQVVAVRHTLERARTRWPESSGALYYKLNDNYPAASWSSVDWYGAPKPLHYFAQDSFSPLASVVLFEKTDMHGRSVSLPVFLLDDNLDLRKSSWTVRVRVFDQDLTQTGGVEFTGKGNQKSVTRLGELILSSEQTRTSPLLIVSEVLAGGKLAFRTFYYMNFEQQPGSLFNLPRTTLSLMIRGNKAVVRNTGKVPAAGVNLQAAGRADKFVASDNFFWLDAGESAEVEVNFTTELCASAWNLDGTEQVNAP